MRVLVLLLVLAFLGAALVASTEDEGPPSFRRDAPRTQTQLEGNRLVLTCLADGSLPMQYRWLRNGSDVFQYSEEHRYVIPSVRPEDAGSYQCVARNKFGALLQPPTEVQVVYLGEVQDGGERRVVVSRGGTLILDPPRVASHPPAQITWFREGRKVSTGPRVAITHDSRLVVMAMSGGEAGTYRAHILNERNGEVRAGPATVVTLGDGEGEAEAVYVRVVMPPRNASAGASAANEPTFECVADGRPVDKVSVTWRVNGVPVSAGVTDFGRRLSLSPPAASPPSWAGARGGDAARVECEASLVGVDVPPVSRSAYFTLLESPHFIVELERSIVGTVDQTIEIPCRATGWPRPSLSWYRDAVPVRQLQEGRLRVLPGGALQVSRPRERDSAVYQCVARSAAGEAQSHAHVSVLSFAPNITRGPVEGVLVEGDTVVIPCDVQGAPRPTLTWLKGGVKLSLPASPRRLGVEGGPLAAAPRLSLLESGGLRVAPVQMLDSGTYACQAKNYRGDATASARITVWVRTRISDPPRDKSVVRGGRAELQCGVTHDPAVSVFVAWEKDGAPLGTGPPSPSSSSSSSSLPPGSSVLVSSSSSSSSSAASSSTGGSLWGAAVPPTRRELLVVPRAMAADTGTYACRVTSAAGNDTRRARLDVREMPHPPQNVRARVSATYRRVAEVSWVRGYDGNSALVGYTLEFSVNGSPWRILLQGLPADSLNVSTPPLAPGSSCRFRLSGLNGVGTGEPSAESERISFPEEPPDAPPRKVVTSGRTNETIVLQWLPPLESQWNGPLKGYLIRYKLADSGADYQYKNLPNAELGSYVLEELRVWTGYAMAVAAYNGAGLGPYSSPPARDATLEGVPTAPPERVQAEAVNSSAIKITWRPPDPLRTNGIPRAYRLLVRRTSSVANDDDDDEDAGAAADWLVAPDSSDPLHVAVATGLPAYTEFAVTVRCATSPGEGPENAPPARARTLHDVPGRVENLTMSDVDGPSLRLSWDEPRRKNGVLLGYSVSWEQVNTTHSRVTHHLAAGIQLHRVGGLAPHSAYRLCVTARTEAGSGSPSCATVTSGVAPEQPGAPTIAAVSTVTPRSVVLQFRSGFDGKSSILRWLAESQTGLVDESDEWSEVFEMDNDPSTRSIEIPNLNPYTFYRFRLRQAGVGGVSAPSLPSRWIQTLPAPPDVPPQNVSVRTAGATSLWVRWVPLAEWQYNGMPESLGYRIRVVRASGPSEPPVDRTVPDRSEREATLAPLRPHVPYEVRLQAYNAVGSGPWSEPVSGFTKEAAPSAGPSDVSANATGPTSLLVDWGPVPEAQRNGLILGFKVLYRAVPHHGATADAGDGADGRYDGGGDDHEEEGEAGEEEDEEGGRGGGDASEDAWLVKLVPGTWARHASLVGLRKHAVYEVRVRAYTRAGDGTRASEPAVARTLDDVPGPPGRVLFPDVNASAVLMVWQPPSEPSGVILGYKVSYWPESSNRRAAIVSELGAAPRSFRAADLLPESAYRFRVLARTRRGYGEAAELSVIVTTSRGRPDAPSRPVLTPHAAVTARAVTLSWGAGGDHAAPLRHFTLQTRATGTGGTGGQRGGTAAAAAPSGGGAQAPGRGWRTHVAWIPPNLTAFTVMGLRPYTTFRFRVSATNDVGASGWSEESEEIATLQAAPERPPRIVLVSPHSTTSVLLKWEPPEAASLNGVLLGYRVHYREVADAATPAAPPSAQPSQPGGHGGGAGGGHGGGAGGAHAQSALAINPSPMQAQLLSKYDTKILNNSSMRRYELSQLTKFRRYEVIVSAYNAAGEGPPTAPLQVYVGEAVPSAPPQSVVVRPTSSTQLEVTWDPPPAGAHNGIIQGYKVYYSDAGRREAGGAAAAPESARTLFLPETSVRLRNLTGYTAYAVAVCAYNSAGEGPRAGPVTARTLAAAPSAPSFLRFWDVTSTSLNVTWGPPAQPNGVLSGYRLVYKPSLPVHGVSKIVSVEVRADAPRWLRVKDLAPALPFQFRVRARTFAFGPELEANVSTAPAHGAPGPPGSPVVYQYGHEVHLQWSHGDPGLAPVTGYLVEARPSDDGLWDLLAKDIPREATSHSLRPGLLRRGLTYTFRMSAVNRYGSGTPGPPSQPLTTHLEAAFYDEWWFLVVVALSGLLLILLLVFVLVVRGQRQRHKRRAHSGAVVKGGTLGNQEMVSLDERFAASLELSERRLPVKNTFCHPNGAPSRSPSDRSPTSLGVAEDEAPAQYAEFGKSDSLLSSPSLKHKLSDIPESPLSERESECDAEGPAPAPAPACDFAGEPEPGAPAAHSFVDHYATEAPYYGSWRRQRPTARACCGERGEAEGANHAVRQYPSAEGLAGLGPGFTMSGFSSFV
ncbi:LOW QUALITY PROTEIN: protein sidekick-2-like [Lampetra fluviatilis]